jgi:hypothetical protein
VVTDIDLDPQSGAARCLNLGDGAIGGHVLGLEFLIRAQVQISDRDLAPNPASRFA